MLNKKKKTEHLVERNKIKMNSKKAILLPETLKIIIAVLCIFLLVYLSVSLYGIFTRSSKLEQAKATLEGIIGKANALEDSESVEYLITAPKDWVLLAYTPTSSQGLCTKNCACICPKLGLRDNINYVEVCKKQGVCLNAENFNSILVQDQTDASLKTDVGRISFSKVPLVLTIVSLNKELSLLWGSSIPLVSDTQKPLSQAVVTDDSGTSVSFFDFVRLRVPSACPADFEFSRVDREEIASIIKAAYLNKDINLNSVAIIRRTSANRHYSLLPYPGIVSVSSPITTGGIAKKGEVFCSSSNAEIFLEFKYKNEPTDPAQQ